MAKVMWAAVCIFMLSGCAGTLSSVVKESEKDQNSSFDGAYNAKVDHPGGVQPMGPGWQSKCAARDFTVPFNVEGSEISSRWGDTMLQGFVNQEGKFRIEQPLEASVKGIGSMMSDGSVTIILQGDVSEGIMKGLLTYGIAQFSNNGCSYPVSYSKG